MPPSASLRAVVWSLALAITAGAALADAAHDCKDATRTPEERETACQKAAAEAASYEGQAYAHLNAGRSEDGLAAATRAVEIASYLTLDTPQEDQTAAERMVNLGPEHEVAQALFLRAMAQTGAVDEAIAAYRQAQAAGAEDRVGYLVNAFAFGLYETGRHEKALQLVEEWLAAHPEPVDHLQYAYTLDTAAHVMAAAGQADEAVATFLRAAELGGTGLRVEYRLYLASLGFAPGEGAEDFEAALRACAATGEACKLFLH